MISVTIATVLALGATTVSGYLLADKYRRNLEYSYQRALNDLSAYVTNIESTLTKAVYANTLPQQNGIANMLMSQSSGAKSALAALPLKGNELTNVNKFIAQVGDFSRTLSVEVSSGGKISDQEYRTILSLKKYAGTLKNDLSQMEENLGSGSIKIGETERLLDNLNNASPVLNENVQSIVKDFTDYPTLIYDGPFSDNIRQQKPKALDGKLQIPQGNAQNIAAEFMGISESALTHTNDTDGNMPTYNFNSGSIRISVTKMGGNIATIINSRDVSEANLDYGAASKKAQEFFKSHKITGMRESYYVIHDNVCTINYAYSENNIVYYPDLIKVSVALDNGDIVNYNATGYLMNHHNRKTEKASISMDTAEKSVSKHLKIERGGLTVIPTPGQQEILCYEFLCTGDNKEKVLVYINTHNGYEQQIYILLFSDNGILVK